MADLSEILRRYLEHQERLEIVFNYQVMHLEFTLLRPTLHAESRHWVQLKSCIPIGAKVEISPKGFYTRSQG
jgi:hypothetical protein